METAQWRLLFCRPAAGPLNMAIDEAILEEALHLARECDLFLALGSSLVVHPAAGLPALAKDHGARLVIIDSGADNVPWLEWVRAAKDDPSTEAVPILAFGSHKDIELRNRALGAGVDRYLARSNFSEGLNEFVAAAVREARELSWYARTPYGIPADPADPDLLQGQ